MVVEIFIAATTRPLCAVIGVAIDLRQVLTLDQLLPSLAFAPYHLRHKLCLLQNCIFGISMRFNRLEIVP